MLRAAPTLFGVCCALLLHVACGFVPGVAPAARGGACSACGAAAASPARRAPAPQGAEGSLPTVADGIVPLHDYVLVDLQSEPDKSLGGILLPTVYEDVAEKNDEAFVKPQPRAGTIVAIGPGRRSNNGKQVIPMPPFKVGQKVVVGAEKGERVQLDGQSVAEATHYLFRTEECARRGPYDARTRASFPHSRRPRAALVRRLVGWCDI